MVIHFTSLLWHHLPPACAALVQSDVFPRGSRIQTLDGCPRATQSCSTLRASPMSFPTSKQHGYLPVPNIEDTVTSPRPRSDLEAPPKYSYFEDIEEQEYAPTRQRKRSETWKATLTVGLLVVAAMYALVSGLRGAFGGTRCHGKSGLPTHYTLPSGDKIPSVALGVCVILWRGNVLIPFRRRMASRERKGRRGRKSEGIF
jgi:hypothetical protein